LTKKAKKKFMRHYHEWVALALVYRKKSVSILDGG
jgi:hypothetical protein